MAADREAQFQQLEDLSQEDLARFILSMIHRMNIHHTLWFRETEHQLGMERALDILEQVTQQSSRIEIQRLGKVLGFEVQDGIPKPLLDLPREKLLELTGEIGKNWLAMDGLWFQAIERAYGMNDAKRCNDSCWNRFSQVEARFIKSFLGLPERPGLEGLKQALGYRMYSILPAFSGLLASSVAAQRAAPEEIPTSSPSVFESSLPVL